MASGSVWNLWVWLVGVVVRRYIDFLILLIPTPLVSVFFCCSIPTFCSFLKCFSFLLQYVLVIKLCINFFFAQYKHKWATTGIPRQPYEGLHIMFYTRRSTHKRTLHILRWTSAVSLVPQTLLLRNRVW